MRNYLPALGLMAAVAATALPAQGADDWSFIAGKYAVDPGDCKHLAKGKPFSKALVKLIDSEVLTREGITSQRETHCRFRSATKQAGTSAEWKVKAACEELGKVSQEEVAIAKNADGSLVVTSEDVFGPPLKFSLCSK
jgi:hypothetical protein